MSTSVNPPSGFFSDVGTGLLYYSLTSVVVLVGVLLGDKFLERPPQRPNTKGDLWNAFSNWDGTYYKMILQQGYKYDPHSRSNVAFFPAFPLLSRCVTDIAGVRPELALLFVSQVSLAGAFIVLARYLRRRFPAMSSDGRAYVLLAFGLWPTTCFCRFAYSESLFLFCTVLSLYAMEQRWPLAFIAWIVGFATAVRPVGVSLLVPLFCHIWRVSPDMMRRVVTLLLFGAFACWGIGAYVVYQAAAFGDPLAFAHTQDHWRMRGPVVFTEKLIDLATLEPIRSIFDASSPCCWTRHGESSALFSLHLANPLYWLAALGLLFWGVRQRWLSVYEVSLSAPLLFIPYFLRSHEMCMASMGRFSAVVFPIYIVLGRLLFSLPQPVAAGLLGISAFFLGTYAAFFAAWYRFF